MTYIKKAWKQNHFEIPSALRPLPPLPPDDPQGGNQVLEQGLGSTAQEQEAVTMTLQMSWGVRQGLPFIPRENEVGWVCFHLLQGWDLVEFRYQENLCGFVFLLLFFIELVTILLLFMFWLFWPRGMWALSPQAGMEPASLALEGKVLTTGRPGNSLNLLWSWKAETGSLKGPRCL